MKKLLGIIVVSMLWCNVSLSGDVTYELYKVPKDAEASQVMDLYVDGLLQGIRWANASAQSKNKDTKNFERPFCPPEKLVLEVANAKTIIDQTAKVMSKGISETELNNTPLVQLLLVGLTKTFPCK